MAVNYFGQFLVQKNYITRENLSDAVKLQKETNQLLGQLATAKKYITLQQLIHILNLQLYIERPFGEIAVSKGFLTREQLEELLTTQKKTHLYLGEALVKLNALSSSQLEKYLAEYNAEQKEAQLCLKEEFQQFPPNYEKFFDTAVRGFQKLFSQIFCENVKVYRFYKGFPDTPGIRVFGEIGGNYDCTVGMAFNDDTAANLTTYLRETSKVNQFEDNETALKEFFKLVFIRLNPMLYENGIRLELGDIHCIMKHNITEDSVLPNLSYTFSFITPRDVLDIYWLLKIEK